MGHFIIRSPRYRSGNLFRVKKQQEESSFKSIFLSQFFFVLIRNDHKIHIGSGVEIRTQISELFYVEERSLNGSWLTGWGVQEGVAAVKATLESVIHPKHGRYGINPPLTTEKELFIYPRIAISPSEVVLPWDPVIKPK